MAVDHVHVEGDRGGLGVLDGVGDRLGRDVVGGGLDVLVEVGGGHVQDDGQVGRADQLGEGGDEAVVETAGSDAVGQLPELAHGGAELGDGLVEDCGDVHAASEAALGQP